MTERQCDGPAMWRGPTLRYTAQAGDRLLAARFLEHTDHDPNGFGSHLVLGDGPLAATRVSPSASRRPRPT
ncbi:hypothetical protein [Streptomyces sp. NPDC102282]|uniref:hypothetical protein n=1 Tax=Streptomyces sp. NPDC102282 TaxID=3366154 RepID=UPI00382106E7